MAPQSTSQRRWCLRNRERINAKQKLAYRAGKIPSRLRPLRLHDYCVVCGKPIPDERRTDAKYCAKACEQAMHVDRKRARRQAGTEYRETPARLKERFKAWSAKNPESIRAYRQTRRARRKHVFAEHIKPIEVFKRDRWVCQLCKRATPRALLGTASKRKPTVDHIVPLSKGGCHTFQNVQCACAECNGRKNAKVKGQFRLF